MSRTIDEKIVEMKFDNSNFEKNVKTSMSTLDKLKEKLNFDGLADGLIMIGTTVAKSALSFKPMQEEIDQTGNKFDRMYIIAKRVLENITDSVMRLGHQITKSLVIDQVTAGWSKYEEKTTGVQTILSATGESLETVNEQLEALNWFTDETSYNFTDMVSNIGKFTSAGVDLKTAVASMQGIATWASASGAGISAASRAMYNLSQAMGVGAVKLMDWKSIENANMGTKAFKEQVLETAEALGVLEKQGADAQGVMQYLIKGTDKTVSYKDFSQSLSEGWFNTDVLNTVLNKYGTYASAVRAVTEIEDNGFETASEAMREINRFMQKNEFKSVEEAATAINERFKLTIDESKVLYESWHSVGREAFRMAQEAKTFHEAVDATKDAVSSQFMNIYETIFGDYEEAKILWTGFAEELYNIFAGPLEGIGELLDDTLYHDKAWKSMIEEIGFSSEAVEEAMLKVTKGMTFTDEELSLDELISKFGSLEKVSERGIITNEILQKTFDELTGATLGFTNAQIDASQYVDAIAKGGRIKLLDSVVALYERLKEVLEPIKEAWAEVFPPATVDTLSKLIDKIHDFATGIEFSEKTLTDLHDIFKGVFDVIKTVGGIFTRIAKIVSSLLGPAVKVLFGIFADLGRTLSEITQNGNFDSIFDFLNGIVEKVIPTEDGINKIADAFHKLFGIFFVEGPDGEKSFNIIGGFFNLVRRIGEKVRPIFYTIADAIKQFFSNLTVKDVGNLISGGVLSKFLLDAVGFLKDLKDGINSKFGIADFFNNLSDTLGALQEKLKPSKLKEIATAIAIIAASIFVLSFIKEEDLTKAGAAIAGLLLELTLGMKYINGIRLGSAMERKMNSLSKLAGILLVMAIDLKVLASIDPRGMVTALIALPVVMVELGAVISAINSMKIGSTMERKLELVKTFAWNSILLAISLKILSTISWDGILRGLVALGGVMLELAAFMALTKGINGSGGAGKGLLSMAASMIVFGIAMKIFASMNDAELGKGLLAIGVGLAEFAVAAKAMNGSLKGATALVIMASALLILVPALFLLGKIHPAELGKRLLALAGALLILGLAAYALNDSLKGAASILILAVALDLLVPALMLLSRINLLDAVEGLIALGGALAVLFVASVMLKGSELTMLALAASFSVIGIGAFALSAGLMLLVTAISSLSSALQSLSDAIPLIINIGMEIIMRFLMGISANIYRITVVVSDIVVSFLVALSEKLPEIVDAGVLFIIAFVDGLANTIREKGPEVLAAIGNLVSSLIELIMTAVQGLLGDIPVVGGWIKEKLEGLKTGVRNWLAPDYASKIATENGEAITDSLSESMDKGEPKVEKSTKGIFDNVTNVLAPLPNEAVDVGVAIPEGLAAGMTGNYAQNLISNAGWKLGQWAIGSTMSSLDEHSPSKEFFKIGEFTSVGFGEGVLSRLGYIRNTMGQMGEESMNGMRDAISSLGKITDFDAKTMPVIRPVVDLSDVRTGAAKMNTMLNGNYVAGMSGSTTRNLTNSIKIQNGGNTVAAAITGLKEDLNAMKDEMLGMRIVMDSGALVGSISTKMDSALGTISTYKGRGNI